MVRMIRALLLIAGVILMPAHAGVTTAVKWHSSVYADSFYLPVGQTPSLDFLFSLASSAKTRIPQASVYQDIVVRDCSVLSASSVARCYVDAIYNGSVYNSYSFSWSPQPSVTCPSGQHWRLDTGACVSDCSEGEEEDANGQCKPKCDVGYERGEDGQCQPMEPKTPGELIPTNLNSGEPGYYGWEDSSISGPDTVRGPGGTACYGGHEYVYYSTVCTAHQTSGVYNCIAVDGRYTGNFCGGTTNPDYQAPGGGGNTPDPDPGNPDPGGNPGSNPDPGGNPGSGGTGGDGGSGGTGGDGSGSGGTGGTGGSGSGGAGDDGDDDMADIPPDDEFNSGDYDVLKPDEGTVRGWMQSAVHAIGLGPGGQCGNAQLESSIFGRPVNLNFVNFCTAIAPIINWFFWILVAYSVINTAMHMAGARAFADADSVKKDDA